MEVENEGKIVFSSWSGFIKGIFVHSSHKYESTTIYHNSLKNKNKITYHN